MDVLWSNLIVLVCKADIEGRYWNNKYFRDFRALSLHFMYIKHLRERREEEMLSKNERPSYRR